VFGRRRPTDRLAELACPNVVVHLRDKRSIAGVLTGVYDRSVTLRAATLLVEGVGAEAMDGEQVIPRDNIGWVSLDVRIADPRLANGS
jgi:hypothetical protein